MQRWLITSLPIFAFMLGAIFTYFARKFAVSHQHLRWHALSALIIFIGVLITANMAQFVASKWTVLSLSFIAAVQLESFKRMRGAPYTNTMMTGNLKNMSVFIVQGLVERKPEILKRGYYTFLIITGFCLGVFISTFLAHQFDENALYALLPIIFGFNLVLYFEKVNGLIENKVMQHNEVTTTEKTGITYRVVPIFERSIMFQTSVNANVLTKSDSVIK